MVMLALAGLCMLAAGVIVLVGRSSGPDMDQRWYYDLETGSLFQASVDAIPPVTVPSGKMGVRAYRFGCGGCKDPSRQTTVYLASYSPQDKQKIESLRQSAMDSPEKASVLMVQADTYAAQHKLIAAPSDLKWLADPEARLSQELLKQFAESCSGADVIECHPRR